jgi:hypothetical protein
MRGSFTDLQQKELWASAAVPCEAVRHHRAEPLSTVDVCSNTWTRSKNDRTFHIVLRLMWDRGAQSYLAFRLFYNSAHTCLPAREQPPRKCKLIVLK